MSIRRILLVAGCCAATSLARADAFVPVDGMGPQRGLPAQIFAEFNLTTFTGQGSVEFAPVSFAPGFGGRVVGQNVYSTSFPLDSGPLLASFSNEFEAATVHFATPRIVAPMTVTPYLNGVAGSSFTFSSDPLPPPSPDLHANGYINPSGDAFLVAAFDALQFSSPDNLDLYLGDMELYSTVPTPEPGTFALLGTGVLGLVGVWRRRLH